MVSAAIDTNRVRSAELTANIGFLKSRRGFVLRDQLQLRECAGKGIGQAPHGPRLELLMHGPGRIRLGGDSRREFELSPLDNSVSFKPSIATITD